MKSSVSSRRNPFPPSSKKTQYHQSLSKKDKNTAGCPVRSYQRSSHSPKNQQKDEKSDHHTSTADETHVYTDYWPSSDWESPPGRKTSPHKQYDSAVRWESAASSSQEVHQQNSVLAKYVERFRHGRPRSRDQRQQMASATAEEPASFWWLSPSPPSSPTTSTPRTADKHFIPAEEDDDDPVIFSGAAQRRRDRSLSPCRESLGGLSDNSQADSVDIEILSLQERASRNLLRGECLVEGSVPVSSEGVRSSDFSPTVIVDELGQRPLTPSIIDQTTVKKKSVHGASYQKPTFHSFHAPTRPEEDILFQWRFRRKMEQAGDWAPTPQCSNFHGPSLNRPSPSSFLPLEEAYKQPHSVQPLQSTYQQVPAPQPETNQAHNLNLPPAAPPPLPPVVVSSSSAPQPHSIAHVPAHMHLLCDVLPCPMKSPHPGQSVSQRSESLESNVVHKKILMKDKCVNTVPIVSPCERIPAPHPASSGTVHGDGSSNQSVPVREKERKPETTEAKSTGICNTKQKKSARSGSHGKLSKKKGRNQEVPSERRCDDHKPPSSPVHRALEKAVSEVLFFGGDSPPAPSVSPPCTDLAHSQSSVPPGSAHNSAEVISQLLQEAEDSDEKEFEDDPLLQVLRKQRKRVKERIREVDSMLAEILEGQQAT